MIRLKTNLPGFFNELCEVVRLFLGPVEIGEAGEGEDGAEGDALVVHTHAEAGGVWTERVTGFGREQALTEPAGGEGLERKRRLKRAVKTAAFLLMREVTGVNPPWGSLTGIRPTRILYELMGEGLSMDQARDAMEKRFFVHPEKASLLCDIAVMQRGLIDVSPREYDVYVGIPFCVTRCAYCSFSSGELGDGRLVEPYIDALIREMDALGPWLADQGLTPRAFYMGGGMPTSLTAAQLRRVLMKARELFPQAREWTVEAGRPDTIDREKLQALKDAGVGRISVNPQTFSDRTLQVIGRAHTAAQTLEGYALAREMGFGDINMDLIAALPGEGGEDFLRSLETCVDLCPESITVHTLAIKRSSRLHEQGYAQPGTDAAARMVGAARARIRDAGYGPYYLYRQKYMAGNLENVGYARPGFACLYNIDNMEETTRVLAFGAGAITKWLFDRERRIERAPNVRNIEQYIARVDEMIERKKALIGGE